MVKMMSKWLHDQYDSTIDNSWVNFRDLIIVIHEINDKKSNISVEFSYSDSLPYINEVLRLINQLDKFIIENNNEESSLEREIVLELQIAIILSYINGVPVNEFFSWSFEYYLRRQLIIINKSKLSVPKNKYCAELIDSLYSIRAKPDKIFKRIKISKLIDSINLLLLVNGGERTIQSLSQLNILYGRYMYCKHGRTNEDIREFLYKYFNVPDNISLLAHLGYFKPWKASTNFI